MRNKERELVPPGGMNGRIVPRQDWGTIPKYTLEALIDYVEHGRPVGSFLYAVVAGDLFGAFRGADNRNRHCIGDIIRWLWNVPPGCCYGSEARVAAWMAMTPMQRSVVLEQCPTWQDFMEEWESGDDGSEATRPIRIEPVDGDPVVFVVSPLRAEHSIPRPDR